MAKIPPSTVEQWKRVCQDWLATEMNLRIECITIGADAWTVAHRSGILRDAYEDRSVYDAHIQTALRTIFPNATFQDKKRY